MTPTMIPWVRNEDDTPGRVWELSGGCTKVSSGCENCYACRLCATRLRGKRRWTGLATKGDTKGSYQWTGEFRLFEENLSLPLSVRKRTTWFVNSKSDFFHPYLPTWFRDRAFAVMAACPRHTFIILTKRSMEMGAYLRQRTLDPYQFAFHAAYVRWPGASHATLHLPNPIRMPLPNVWVGVSVEDQLTANHRIPELVRTPAAVRFVSAEPLLGPVDLDTIPELFGQWGCDGRHRHREAHADGTPGNHYHHHHDERCKFPLDWVIVGGESGPRARPTHPHWVCGLRDQATAAGVPFYFKQWGAWEPSFHFATQFEGVSPRTPIVGMAADGHRGHSIAEMEGHPLQGLFVRTGAKRAGNLLDGKRWEQMPERGGGVDAVEA